MPRSKQKKNGTSIPAGASHLLLEEAATLLRTTTDALYKRVMREQIPSCCVVRRKKGERILLIRSELEKHCLKGGGR